jgi:hypothetical protein
MNIALLAAKHGQELGWVCLGFCGLDVVIFPCLQNSGGDNQPGYCELVRSFLDHKGKFRIYQFGSSP